LSTAAGRCQDQDPGQKGKAGSDRRNGPREREREKEEKMSIEMERLVPEN